MSTRDHSCREYKACALAIFGKIFECMFFSRPTHTVKTTTMAFNYTIFHPHKSIFKGHVSTPTDHPFHFHTHPDKPIECSGAKECVGEYFGDGVDSYWTHHLHGQLPTIPRQYWNNWYFIFTLSTTINNITRYDLPIQPIYIPIHQNVSSSSNTNYNVSDSIRIKKIQVLVLQRIYQ